MRNPAIIRHGASAEEMAEIYGIPISRVKTIEQMLLRSRQKQTASVENKKTATRSKTGKKRSVRKAK